jgi:hypothetical protein
MMLTKITKLKGNPSNPRVLRDDKFAKLKKSIEEFPDMLNKRPIVAVTDKDGKLMVLGGNMRLRACQELGLKEVPVILADDWTEEQRREFIVKDNVGYGEWDWDQLANEWDVESLADWGVSMPIFHAGDDIVPMPDLPDLEESDFVRMTFTLHKEQVAEVERAMLQMRTSTQLRFTEWMRTQGVTAKQIDDATNTHMGGHYLTSGSQPAVPTPDIWKKIRPMCKNIPAWVDEMVERGDGVGNENANGNALAKICRTYLDGQG